MKNTSSAIRLFALAAGCGLVAFGQFRLPASGFVVDSQAGTVRPVVGIPGAWTLGSTLELESPILHAKFAVQRDFALVILRETPYSVSVLQSPGQAGAHLVSIPGALSADLLVLNERETSALLFSQQERRLQWVEGLPEHPTVVRTLSMTDVSGTLTALALNRSGDLAFAGFSSEEGGLLYRIPLNGSPRSTGSVKATSIVFASNDTDAFVSDAEANQILIANDGLLPVAGEASGILAPRWLQAAGLNHLLVATAGGSKLACLNLADGRITQTDLPVPASRLERLGPNQWLLNEPGDGPVYVADASAVDSLQCTPTVLFIPPATQMVSE